MIISANRRKSSINNAHCRWYKFLKATSKVFALLFKNNINLSCIKNKITYKRFPSGRHLLQDVIEVVSRIQRLKVDVVVLSEEILVLLITKGEIKKEVKS